MSRWKFVVAFALALFLAIFPLPVRASVVIDIQRISDTEGILTVSGSLSGEPGVDGHTLDLVNPFGIGPGFDANDSVFGSSTMQVGNVPINFAYDCGGYYGCAPDLYFGDVAGVSLVPGATFSGELVLQLLTGPTFAAVGSTGNVEWGLFSNNVVGTWEITAATPLPAALPLFATGLGAMGLIGWRRKRKAQTVA